VPERSGAGLKNEGGPTNQQAHGTRVTVRL
jgi:hypothetical protein